MVYVTMYRKGIGASAKAKIVHRYLPRKVGEYFFFWIIMTFCRKPEGAAMKEAAMKASPLKCEPRGGGAVGTAAAYEEGTGKQQERERILCTARGQIGEGRIKR